MKTAEWVDFVQAGHDPERRAHLPRVRPAEPPGATPGSQPVVKDIATGRRRVKFRLAVLMSRASVVFIKAQTARLRGSHWGLGPGFRVPSMQDYVPKPGLRALR